jgi:two-component system, chemotaxis family, chemotaxis protein CheY
MGNFLRPCCVGLYLGLDLNFLDLGPVGSRIHREFNDEMFATDTRILVVDDSTFSRNIVKNGLTEMQFWKISEAGSAKEAQDILISQEKANEPIQLLICDVHMPGMTGIELLKWIRGSPTLAGMPVIILTSSQEKKEVVNAARLGVSHFVIKPFELSTLKERLVSAWEKHGKSFLENQVQRRSS